MNRELIPAIEPLVEHLRRWIGSSVRVSEQITRLPGNYDRHFATSSIFVLQLRDVGIAFSGGGLWLVGDAGGFPAEYQATVELLETLSVQPGEVVFVECFGPTAERRSVFALAVDCRAQ